jgi:hypothetical protein
VAEAAPCRHQRGLVKGCLCQRPGEDKGRSPFALRTALIASSADCSSVSSVSSDGLTGQPALCAERGQERRRGPLRRRQEREQSRSHIRRSHSLPRLGASLATTGRVAEPASLMQRVVDRLIDRYVPVSDAAARSPCGSAQSVSYPPSITRIRPFRTSSTRRRTPQEGAVVGDGDHGARVGRQRRLEVLATSMSRWLSGSSRRSRCSRAGRGGRAGGGTFAHRAVAGAAEDGITGEEESGGTRAPPSRTSPVRRAPSGARCAPGPASRPPASTPRRTPAPSRTAPSVGERPFDQAEQRRLARPFGPVTATRSPQRTSALAS